MDGMQGADVAELRRLGRRLDEAAETLGNLKRELDTQVRSDLWRGPNARMFRDEWSSGHGPAVDSARDRLSDAAAATRRNADAQERASQSLDSGTSGGYGDPGRDRSDRSDRPGSPDVTDDLGSYKPLGPIDNSDANIQPDMIKQGQVGDCWFLAGLGAVAKDDPEFLQQHMRQNPDGTWTVTMYKDGKPVDIVVEPTVPENGAKAPDGSDNFASIYEKAAAEYFGGDYEDIDGGQSSDAFEAITGQPAEKSGELDLKEIQDRLKDGPVAVGTEDDDALFWWEEEVENKEIVPNHAYIVDEVKEVDGELKIHVLNPWGPAGGQDEDGQNKVGDMWMTEEEYKKNFDSVYSAKSSKDK